MVVVVVVVAVMVLVCCHCCCCKHQSNYLLFSQVKTPNLKRNARFKMAMGHLQGYLQKRNIDQNQCLCSGLFDALVCVFVRCFYGALTIGLGFA